MATKPVDVNTVPANATTAEVGATGSDASNLVMKDTGVKDPNAPQADHDQEKGLPGAGKSTFSHANDFAEGHNAVTDKHAADPNSVEALAAGTAAQNHGDSQFMASLDNAAESNDTTV